MRQMIKAVAVRPLPQAEWRQTTAQQLRVSDSALGWGGKEQRRWCAHLIAWRDAAAMVLSKEEKVTQHLLFYEEELWEPMDSALDLSELRPAKHEDSSYYVLFANDVKELAKSEMLDWCMRRRSLKFDIALVCNVESHPNDAPTLYGLTRVQKAEQAYASGPREALQAMHWILPDFRTRQTDASQSEAERNNAKKEDLPSALHRARGIMKAGRHRTAWKVLKGRFPNQSERSCAYSSFHLWHEAAICAHLLLRCSPHVDESIPSARTLIQRVLWVPSAERDRFLHNLLAFGCLEHPACALTAIDKEAKEEKTEAMAAENKRGSDALAGRATHETLGEKERHKPALWIWCGDRSTSGEAWDFAALEHGIGGSEEAVIHMAHALATHYDVTVLGFPTSQSNSECLPSRNPHLFPSHCISLLKDKASVIVSWRQLTGLDLLAARCDQLYLWLHDLPFEWLPRPQSKIMAELACSIPKLRVMFLSDFHRRVFVPEWPARIGPAAVYLSPNLPPAAVGSTEWDCLPRQKCFVTRNGLAPSDFASSTAYEIRRTRSCIYASNYRRGLAVLLHSWPAIRKEFPDATLRVFYGWPASDEPIESIVAMLRVLKTDGVSEHGRVGQEQLAKEMQSSQFWTYPCTFDETFCITAIKAQAAGCIPVIIRRGALSETVSSGYGCTQENEYTELLLRAMRDQNEGVAESARIESRQVYAQQHSWATIASEWWARFRGEK